MQRRLRITLAMAAAAGVAVLGAGTAEAQGAFKSDKDCTRGVSKSKPAKETDYPSYGEGEAESNATSKDPRDASGNLYYVHNSFCDAPRPWRGHDWDDDSYDTFHFKRDSDGLPSRDTDKNSYNKLYGYNSSFRKDPHKYTKLDRDHIGAPKHPKYATE